jgi:hypothetical protein
MAPPVQGTFPWLPNINADQDVVVSMTAYILSILQAYQGLQPPVLVQRGERQTTSALVTKYPVEVGSPLFAKVTGGIDYREVANLMLPVTTPDPYADAVKALVLRMQSNEWTGWGKQPAMVAIAANLIGELAIAAAIEAGETTPSADNYLDGGTVDQGFRFFQQNRPCDPLGNNTGVKSNLFTGGGTAALGNTDAAAPLTLANIDRVWQHIRSVKSQNGKYTADLKWVATLVPPQLELKARRYFEDQGSLNDMVDDNANTDTAKSAATGSKAFPTPNTAKKYKIEVIASPYLTVADTWYPICQTQTITTWPWLELTQIPKRQVEFAGAMQPSPQNTNGAGDIQWILDDMNSEGYKHGTKSIPKGYVGIQALKRVSAVLLWFDQMFKCKAA